MMNQKRGRADRLEVLMKALYTGAPVVAAASRCACVCVRLFRDYVASNTEARYLGEGHKSRSAL